METVNRFKMIKAAYGELLRRAMAGKGGAGAGLPEEFGDFMNNPG